MLTCQNICIKRGYNLIVKKISFSLYEGCCLNVYGENGSGKTSLLEYLSSLSGIQKNTILVNKTDVTKALDEYKDITHYIGHKNAIDEDLSVMENLKFWGVTFGNEICIPAAIECFGLERFLDYPVKDLSQGWKRKVALSILLIKNAKIWLLDEPFSNLDTQSAGYLLNLFRIRCEQKGIVIFTSHTPIKENFINNLNISDFK